MPDRRELVSWQLVLTSLLSTFALGCGPATIRPDGPVRDATVETGQKPPAIAFFGRPLLSHVALSPDGRHIAAVSAGGDKEQLVMRETTQGALEGLAVIVRDRLGTAMTIDSIGWSGNDRVLMVITEPLFGSTLHNRRSRVFSVDLHGDVQYLARGWRQETLIFDQGNVVSLLREDPGHVLLGVRQAGQVYPEVLRVDVRDGSYRTVQSSQEGIWDWYADHRGRVRAADGITKPRRGNGELVDVLLAREALAKPWDILTDVNFYFSAFGPSDKEFFVSASSGEGARSAVFRYQLGDQRLGDIVFRHPVVDVSTVVTSEADGRPLFVLYVDEGLEMFFLDETRESLQRLVDRVLPNRFNYFESSDLGESIFIVSSESDVVPPEYYLFDGTTLTLLFKAYPELAATRFSQMQPVEYTARDGLTIHGYVTKPVDAPDGPLATVVLPHGGPFARDYWGWDPFVQFLVNRGFVVFQPNFRGSSGYGIDFSQAGWGEWGLAMQDDITDGVHWLIEQGIADPDRIGIFGMSYGGYAALQGLVRTPELYRCGGSLAGVTDLRLFMSQVKQQLKYVDFMEKLVGKRRADKEKLIAASPAKNADKIRVPVFLAHGTRDANVSVEHVKAMERELRKADVPVELYIYLDEPHTFLDDRNMADVFKKLAAFLEKHLEPDIQAQPN